MTAVIQEKRDTKQRPKWWKLLLEGNYLSRRPRRGDVTSATILAKGDRDILVELDGKRDGVVPPQDLDRLEEDYVDRLEVGDQVPVQLLGAIGRNGGVVVSLSQGLKHQDWLRAQTHLAEEKVFEAEIVDTNRGGVLAEFGRLQGFVPNSHLTSLPRGMRRNERRKLKEDLVGKTLSLVVLEVNQHRRRLVLSEREAQSHLRQALLDELHEGAIRKGIVRNLVDFGAFVDLGGLDGLVHVSEISWEHVAHPREVLNIGDEVEVYVLNVDRERERVGLSIKRLLPRTWNT
ncbi:MAG: 30S ribosomal protein S1 [Anaerolineae bacterium]|nr:30S ribosomal protein S1 [Anaerolineae bacterium]